MLIASGERDLRGTVISLSSNGHAGRLVTTEQPWAESMKAYPGMTVARRRTAR